jgi:selenide, water dikinase
LLGHAAEIARNSGVGLRVSLAGLPALPGAHGYAAAGVAAGGLQRNRAFLERDGFVQYATDIDTAYVPLLFDPQTSGGLLIVLPAAAAATLEHAYAAAGVPCWRIGVVTEHPGITVER